MDTRSTMDSARCSLQALENNAGWAKIAVRKAVGFRTYELGRTRSLVATSKTTSCRSGFPTLTICRYSVDHLTHENRPSGKSSEIMEEGPVADSTPLAAQLDRNGLKSLSDAFPHVGRK